MPNAILTTILSRLDLIKAYYSSDRTFPIPVAEMLVKGLFKARCTRLGPRFIERIDQVDEYLVVRIRSVPTPLYWPRALPFFDLYKVITECFYEKDWHFYEIPETTVVPGDVVLDCGAAEGVFSLRILERAKRIVAFEPLPLFGNSLRKTFLHHPSVAIVPCALGDMEGQAYLAGDSLYGVVNSRHEGVLIKVTTIDKWVEETNCRVDFIKGDLEGFELKVLKGAAAAILRDKPTIALTVYHPGNDWHEMLAYIRSLVPEYACRVKGLSFNGGYARPVMMHCWVNK